MLPGSKIVWEVHYHAVGEAITDSVELGVYFYPKGQEPKHREVLALFNTFTGARTMLDIPPNQVTTTESFVSLKENARIENFQAHMHLRGKGMSMEALYPDGRREMLSQVTDFNFNWHNMYIYTDDVAPLLPKGTLLHLIAWYDNTRGNKSNPDPDQWVGWGDRTIDEMGHAWLNITYFGDEEFKAEVARRNSSRPAALQQRRRDRSRRRSGSDMNARLAVGLVAGVVISAGAWPRAGQQGQGQTPSPLPLSQPIRERGSSVTGAYEGWYRNKDGSVSLLVGYFNRNTKQELDIPIGPNNRIEPGGPDQGQPTHFLTVAAMGRVLGQGARGLRRRRS